MAYNNSDGLSNESSFIYLAELIFVNIAKDHSQVEEVNIHL